MSRSSPYDSIFSRLVANTHEPENGQACWTWAGRRRCRYGYGKTTIYVPGLIKTVSVYAHTLAYVVLESGAKTGNGNSTDPTPGVVLPKFPFPIPGAPK